MRPQITICDIKRKAIMAKLLVEELEDGRSGVAPKTVIPMQAWDVDGLSYRKMICDADGNLNIRVAAQAGVALSEQSAPASTGSPLQVTDQAAVVYLIVPDAGSVGVRLWPGDGSTGTGMPVLPSTLVPLFTPILFPAGFAIRALSGLTAVPTFIQFVNV